MENTKHHAEHTIGYLLFELNYFFFFIFTFNHDGIMISWFAQWSFLSLSTYSTSQLYVVKDTYVHNFLYHIHTTSRKVFSFSLCRRQYECKHIIYKNASRATSSINLQKKKKTNRRTELVIALNINMNVCWCSRVYIDGDK